MEYGGLSYMNNIDDFSFVGRVNWVRRFGKGRERGISRQRRCYFLERDDY